VGFKLHQLTPCVLNLKIHGLEPGLRVLRSSVSQPQLPSVVAAPHVQAAFIRDCHDVVVPRYDPLQVSLHRLQLFVPQSRHELRLALVRLRLIRLRRWRDNETWACQCLKQMWSGHGVDSLNGHTFGGRLAWGCRGADGYACRTRLVLAMGGVNLS